MKIDVRWINGVYAEVTVSDGNASIGTGALTNGESRELAASMREAADQLDPPSDSNDHD